MFLLCPFPLCDWLQQCYIHFLWELICSENQISGQFWTKSPEKLQSWHLHGSDEIPLLVAFNCEIMIFPTRHECSVMTQGCGINKVIILFVNTHVFFLLCSLHASVCPSVIKHLKTFHISSPTSCFHLERNQK